MLRASMHNAEGIVNNYGIDYRHASHDPAVSSVRLNPKFGSVDESFLLFRMGSAEQFLVLAIRFCRSHLNLSEKHPSAACDQLRLIYSC